MLFLSLTLVIQELESSSLWIYFNYIDQRIVAIIPGYKVGNRPHKYNPDIVAITIIGLCAGTQQQRKQWPVLDYVLVFGTQ